MLQVNTDKYILNFALYIFKVIYTEKRARVPFQLGLIAVG